MIKGIKLTNIKTNESIEIGGDSNTVILDYIDWGVPSVTPETYRVPYQIGNTLAGVIVGNREPIIVGYIVADMEGVNTLGMSWEEYYRVQEENIEETKRKLDRVVNIYQNMVINTEGYFLDVVPTSPPRYSSSERENNEVMCQFMLYLSAYEPLFYSEQKNYSLSSIIKKFHFPFYVPVGEKIIIGEIQQRQSILIENNGESPVGCEIIINSLVDGVKDPNIYNIASGDFIGFEGVTMNKGDTLTIKTEIGEESTNLHVSETGKDVNIVGNLLTGSQFLQIKQGAEYYAYSMKVGPVGGVEVFVRFYEKYFNIRGM